MLEVATAGSTKASVISTMPVTQTINTRATSLRTFGSAREDRSSAVSMPRTSQPVMTVKMGNPAAYKKDHANRVVALACSTGGPKSLKEVIPYIASSIDAPVVMVQHMPAGFTKTLADRLNDISNVNVKEAENGDVLKKGWVYLAPGGKHMRIKNDVGDVHSVVLSDEPAIDGLRPCANIMYESLCDTAYDKVICVVLTGMGADGTKGIEALSKEKNVYVIAQDEASSVVYGMPKAVVTAGLADEVKPLNQIAEAIMKNTGVLRDGR